MYINYHISMTFVAYYAHNYMYYLYMYNCISIVFTNSL